MLLIKDWRTFYAEFVEIFPFGKLMLRWSNNNFKAHRDRLFPCTNASEIKQFYHIHSPEWEILHNNSMKPSEAVQTAFHSLKKNSTNDVIVMSSG